MLLDAGNPFGPVEWDEAHGPYIWAGIEEEFKAEEERRKKEKDDATRPLTEEELAEMAQEVGGPRLRG